MARSAIGRHLPAGIAAMLGVFLAAPSPAMAGGRPLPLPDRPAVVLPVDAGSDLMDAIRLMDIGDHTAALERIERAERALRGNGKGVRKQRRQALTLKAQALAGLGRFSEAEKAISAVIDELGAAGNDRRGETAIPLLIFAGILFAEGRFREAEPIYAKVIDILVRTTPGDVDVIAEARNNLGGTRIHLGNLDGGIAELEAARDAFARLGPTHQRNVASITANLGVAYQTRGDFDAALGAYSEAFQLQIALLGPDHPDTLRSLSNAAVIYGLMGRAAEGIPLIEQVVTATRGRYGDDHIQTAHVMKNRGWLRLGVGEHKAALADFRFALDIYRANRALQMPGLDLSASAVDERQVSRTILGLLKASSALLAAGDPAGNEITAEAFIAAQEVRRSKAALALAQTTARLAAGPGDLGDLVRRRQDLAARRTEIDGWLTAALGMPDMARNAEAETLARRDRDAINADLKAIDHTIDERFPDYAALVRPPPLGLGEVQARLKPGEALLLVAPFGGPDGEGIFTFLVTSDDVRWFGRDEYGATALAADIRALRCGLDLSAWRAGGSCGSPDFPAPEAATDLPFEPQFAWRISVAVLGALIPMIEGRTVYVVAPDPLASLPLEVLLSAPPEGDGQDLGEMAWLARSTAFAALPAVASLAGLEAARQAPRAPEPFFGIGDPALLGRLDCPEGEGMMACPEPGRAPEDRVAALNPPVETLLRGGGLADVEAVSALCPLPETATELACVAGSLGADKAAQLTGAAATVPAVIGTALDRYRVIQFATHGLLAGEMQTADGVVAEPALVLTPPAVASAEDDGLLRASAIAGLNLNADWVVLSACNTAAGDSLGGEALSGLASAFLYAGAKALIVSHWPVRSDAAVLLTTTAFEEIAVNPALGRAEAMRRAMAYLINHPSGAYRHPAIWAPFAVVGDAGPPGR